MLVSRTLRNLQTMVIAEMESANVRSRLVLSMATLLHDSDPTSTAFAVECGARHSNPGRFVSLTD
jgi:hypothetical protein